MRTRYPLAVQGRPPPIRQPALSHMQQFVPRYGQYLESHRWYHRADADARGVPPLEGRDSKIFILYLDIL